MIDFKGLNSLKAAKSRVLGCQTLSQKRSAKRSSGNGTLNSRERQAVWPIAAVVALGAILFIGRPPSNLASAASNDKKTHLLPKSDESLNVVESTNSPAQDLIPTNIQEEKFSAAARAYPVPSLERVELSISDRGDATLKDLPNFNTVYGGKVAGITDRKEYVFYTLNPELQEFAKNLVKKAVTPHIAVVAMDPKSGRILALAEKSTSIKDLVL